MKNTLNKFTALIVLGLFVFQMAQPLAAHALEDSSSFEAESVATTATENSDIQATFATEETAVTQVNTDSATDSVATEELAVAAESDAVMTDADSITPEELGATLVGLPVVADDQSTEVLEDSAVTSDTTNQKSVDTPEVPVVAEKLTNLSALTLSCPSQTLSGTVRDFKDTHNNFEVYAKNPLLFGSAPESLMIKGTLGVDNKPIFNIPTISTTNQAEFDQWYNDTPGVNQSMSHSIVLDDSDNDGVFNFSAVPFFPVDGLLWGNQGRAHNYHFTYEVHTNFQYENDTFFAITGDDDVMVFINGQLVSAPLMGVHTAASQTITLTPALAATLGLTLGQSYSFDLFYAERNTSYGQLSMQTNAIFDNCGTPAVPDPVVTLLPTNSTIAPGGSVNLTWTSANAVSCTAIGTSLFPTGGATQNLVGVAVTPVSSTNYTIQCQNSLGVTATSTAHVTVTAGPLVSSVDLLVDGLPGVTVASGTPVTLTWTSVDTTSCVAIPAGAFPTGGATTSPVGGVSITPVVSAVYTISCVGASGDVTDTVTVTVVPPAAAPVVTLTANPPQIMAGQSSALIWSSANTTACASTDFSVNGVTGATVVSPLVTTVYTVSCVNGASAPVTATATVTVVPLATTPTATLVATPTIIPAGSSSVLTWSSTNAVSCAPTGFAGTGISNSTGVVVTPAITTVYTIVCTDALGNDSAPATATVKVIPATDPAVTLTVDPGLVALGTPATLTWSSTNATSCTASWMTLPGNPVSGTQSVTPNGFTTYSIVCSNAAGKTVATSVVVYVMTATLTASPTSITLGGSSVLTWSSTNAISCSSTDFVVPGSATSGNVTVTPTITTIYRITCINGGQTITVPVTITVNPVTPPSSGGGGSGGGFVPGAAFGPGSTTNHIVSITTSTPAVTTSDTASAAPRGPGCPIIKGHWDLGDQHEEVGAIQEFLNKYQNENLAVDGVYGNSTRAAVKRFQTKYKSLVLSPWGLQEATGFWYKSTSKLANYLLGCDITSVYLETEGHDISEKLYTDKAPERIMSKIGDITYLQFCGLTADCYTQTSIGDSRGYSATPKSTSSASRASSVNLEGTDSIDTLNPYEIPAGDSKPIEIPAPESKGWFRDLFGGNQ